MGNTCKCCQTDQIANSNETSGSQRRLMQNTSLYSETDDEETTASPISLETPDSEPGAVIFSPQATTDLHGESAEPEPYEFKAKRKVIIRHPGGGAIRVDPTGSSPELSGNGGNGPFSQFEAHPGPDGERVRLRSVHNRKWLRIENSRGKHVATCSGSGNHQDIFKVHRTDQPGHVKLESEEC